MTSESSSASEFLATSYSSYSSQDSPHGHDPTSAEMLHKRPPPSPIEKARSSQTPRIDPVPQSRINPMPGQYALYTLPVKPLPQRSPLGQETYNIQSQPPSQVSQPLHSNQPSQPMNPSQVSLQSQYSSQALPKTRGYQNHGAVTGRPGPMPRLLSSVSLSETDCSSSDINSGTEFEDDLEYTAAQKHPYYNQWKQYYQAMALYQALMAQKQGASIRNSMFSGAVPSSRKPSATSPPPPILPTSVADYLNSQPDMAGSENRLLRNSRRCTIRSNRSASVPLLNPDLMPEKKMGSRAISMDISTSAKNTSLISNDDTYAQSDEDVPKQSVLVASSSKLIIHHLNEMVLEPEETRQISDYGAYLQDDDEFTSPGPEEIPQSNFNDETVRQPIENNPIEPSSLPEEILHDLEVYSLPPESPKKSVEMSFESPTVIEDLNRQNSTASTSSYNSLQSEKNFFVSKTPNRVATIVSRKLSRKNTENNGPTFVPPMPGPPPPIFTNTPREVPGVMAPEVMMGYTPAPVNSEFHRHSMINLNSANRALVYTGPTQQQYIPQMLAMRPYSVYQPLGPIGGQIAGPFSTDQVINRRIEEFLQLRNVIASGNKTLEYRLKWMKMLLIAINYKLYSYINVKGNGVAPDQAMTNKHLFIKSFVAHLQKLLRELDANTDVRKNKMFAEVCFIQGCLYMNDYVDKYGQDFGFELNNAEAERFLQHCIELDPSYFRAYYKLGELYEAQESEERFDVALEHYKESAQLGYNKAIYKIALISLYVPKVRLIRFYKYLKDLASIDMDLTDIQLEGFDRDELEEVVGQALFQLGKIHEGIYPGDLTADLEFVKEATRLAKVDYARSLSYYNRAAKLQCLEAQVRLGHVYELGELNRKPNASKSIQWFIRATSSPLKFKRHPEAMLGVSRWFLKGSNGTSKYIPYPNPEGAIMWCERACKEFKYPEAYYQMGLLVEGDFVDGDAYEWFSEASQMGHLEAQAKLQS